MNWTSLPPVHSASVHDPVDSAAFGDPIPFGRMTTPHTEMLARLVQVSAPSPVVRDESPFGVSLRESSTSKAGLLPGCADVLVVFFSAARRVTPSSASV